MTHNLAYRLALDALLFAAVAWILYRHAIPAFTSSYRQAAIRHFLRLKYLVPVLLCYVATVIGTAISPVVDASGKPIHPHTGVQFLMIPLLIVKVLLLINWARSYYDTLPASGNFGEPAAPPFFWSPVYRTRSSSLVVALSWFDTQNR